ncbi:zinc finger BED domain-containing protein RICESLEEPER 2 [Lathyrus oleraceus]|uniref:zinc finger BED domain-containing protein RICESLEEPER 2 n=1 Tax=Pisum sativum TaxID=3888 RepID=UPI0021D18417|nr:zinc finger BED domain-containing protein RICESLEEPER 2-like [Pisum sativum]
MTLTTHFINNDWKYENRILSFCLVLNHKGETIGRKVEEILREWGIRNVSTITVDNATSNDVVVAYLKKRIDNMGGLMSDESFFHLRCYAHILNLVVRDGLKQNDLSISAIRNVVRFVRSSPQRSAKFKECIEFARINCKKLLCLDVPTRWNSCYLMLDAAKKYQAAFEKMEGEDFSYLEFFGLVGPPTLNDWENVRCLVSFFKIFYDATMEFSSSKQVSFHKSFHQLASIHCELKRSSMNLNIILA